MGNPRRGSRIGPVGRVSRPRHHRSWLAPAARGYGRSATGGLFRLPGGRSSRRRHRRKDLVRTGPGARAVLRLADGSTVDVNERTELFVTAAWSGRAIHLQRGDVIVQAAKQRRGHLRVLTRDSIASVKGTVFAVSAGMGGSVVSVVEGSVAVNQPGTEVSSPPASRPPQTRRWRVRSRKPSPGVPRRNRPGAPRLVREDRASAGEHVSWRAPHQLALLSYLPAGAFVYGAVPNIGGKLGQAMVLAEQQASENAAFGAWWTSETGSRSADGRTRAVRELAARRRGRVLCWLRGPGEDVPMVMARVQTGRRAELASALEGLFAETEETFPRIPLRTTCWSYRARRRS